jgi:hypothetical protein
MGTRAIITFKSGKKDLCAIYQQMDGYVDGGLGEDLVKMLSGHTLINGFGPDTPENTHNGIDDLAAYVICQLKKDNPLGNVYMFPIIKHKDFMFKSADGHNSMEALGGAEYGYEIREKRGPFTGHINLRIVKIGWCEVKSITLYDGPINAGTVAAAEAAKKLIEKATA